MAASGWTPVDETAAKWAPVEEKEPGFSDILSTAWERAKQAYHGETKLTDAGNATLSGAGSIARGTVGAVKGAAEMLKPPTWEEVESALKDSQASPTMLPITILAKRMGKPLVDVAKLVPEVPGAVKDINASPDPLGTYANVAQETAGQGAGQAITALGTEGVVRGAPGALEAARDVPMSKVTAPVRAAVRGANTALVKAPTAIGTALGASVGAATRIPYATEVGAGMGGMLGKELLPQIKLPGEGFGLPDRVVGGPEVAPPYQPSAKATSQAIQELGPKAPIPSIKARAAEIQARLNEAVGYKPPEPGKPIYQREAAASSPGATEVKATTRSARGFAGGGASELPEQQPRTPAPPGESTAVDKFHYDESANEMHVTGKNGRTYVYGEVTPEQAQMFKDAESKGMAWKSIKDNNPYVAKIMNGKRVAIKRPVASAPDDLTQQLEDSLKMVQLKNAGGQ